MKYISWVVFVSLWLAISCQQKPQDDQAAGMEVAVQQSDEVYLVSDIMQNPDDKVDQRVRVRGTVTHVCRHSGKRLHLVALDGGERIRVEAGNNIVRFERELEGSDIVARGILRKEVINPETIRDMEGKNHEGEGHDDADREENTERAQNYRIMLEDSGRDAVTVYWLEGESFEEI